VIAVAERMMRADTEMTLFATPCSAVQETLWDKRIFLPARVSHSLGFRTFRAYIAKGTSRTC